MIEPEPDAVEVTHRRSMPRGRLDADRTAAIGSAENLMHTPRILVAAALVLGTAATPAVAADVTAVKAPKRVKAGASAKVVVSVDAVTSCRLTLGKVSALAPAVGRTA